MDAAAARSAAKAARVQWIRSLGDAWRGPASSRDVTQPVERHTNVRDARAAATAEYHAMCARVRDAWRTPARDATSAPHEDPAAAMRRHLRAEEVDTAQARRDAAYKEYVRNLGAAWQQGRTDPSRAVEIEQRLERERGKQP